MPLFDLVSGSLTDKSLPLETISTDEDLPDIGSRPEAEDALAISFPKFSDGRGFTQARRLRSQMGYLGALVAIGHVIPDQADFLRRCGFTHVEIESGKLDQWKFSLGVVTTRFQTILNSDRSRDINIG